MKPENAKTRRELFATLGRYAALGGFAAGAAHLIARRPAESSTPCLRQFQCPRCDLAADCILPEAIVSRRILRQGPISAKDRTRSVSGVPQSGTRSISEGPSNS